jgi:dolichol kinase
MIGGEDSWNLLLMLLCYGYVVLIIAISGRLTGILHVSPKVSRKFLHAMIGNLVFVIPFFTSDIYPAFVAAPFVPLTFLASPYSPIKNPRMAGLGKITEEGHPLGLVFYAISYTILAFFFASRPSVVAAGILPMAYGDSSASLVGEKYGRTRNSLISKKTLEGASAMFAGSFFSLGAALLFFSTLLSFPAIPTIARVFGVVTLVTFIEFVSPKGFDNLTVPFLGAIGYWLLTGSI